MECVPVCQSLCDVRQFFTVGIEPHVMQVDCVDTRLQWQGADAAGWIRGHANVLYGAVQRLSRNNGGTE